MYSENEDCCVYFVFMCILNVIEKSDEGEKKYIHVKILSQPVCNCVTI